MPAALRPAWQPTGQLPILGRRAARGCADGQLHGAAGVGAAAGDGSGATSRPSGTAGRPPIALRAWHEADEEKGRAGRLGDARGGRRRTPRGRGRPRHGRLRGSPSGPIHLGNLREFITPHFVAEELRRRGVPVRHLHSWDDFDRFRKVPAGVPAEWAEHIGRPLTAVPDPWECHDPWAEHFKAPLQESLRELGVEMEEVSQTEMYTSGAYRDQVLLAVSRRDEIEAVLAKHRTKKVAAAEDASEQEAADLADSVANEDDDPPTGWPTRSPASPTAPTAASAGATPSPRRTTTPPRRSSYTCSSCASRAPPTCRPTRRQARLEGRLADALGLREGRLRAGRSRPHDARVVVHGRHEIAPSIFGGALRHGSSTPSSGSPACRRCRRRPAACRPRPTRCGSWRRRCCAGSTSGGRPRRPSTSTSAAVVRLYDEWDALGRKAADPDKSDARRWPCTARPRPRRPAATPAVPVPFRRCRRSPT